MRRVPFAFRLLAVTGVLAALAVLPGSPLHAAARVSRHELPGGLTVLVTENRTVDLAAVEVLVGAGPRVEEAAEAGISVFVRETLFRGTSRRSAAEIATVLESLGGSLRGVTSFDYTELAAIVPARHADAALDVLADLTTDARFDPADVEALRRVNVSRLRLREDQPATRAFDLLTGALYQFHPYAKGFGSPDTVAALTRDQLLAFYRTFYTAPNMVVSVAGNLQAAEAVQKVRRAFAASRPDPLPRRVRLLRTVERALAPQPAQAQEVREARRTAAAWITVGYLGVGVGHRDWPALRVMNAILGEGLSSRLFVEIREKQGLAYAVGSSLLSVAGPGAVILSAGTDPANTSRVTEALIREAARLRAAPPALEELERGRQRSIGVHLIDHEDLRRQAFLPAFYELLGAGFGFDARLPDVVARVSGDDVQRVARLYLQPPTVAIVAPPPR